jgi:hypothetical protein
MAFTKTTHHHNAFHNKYTTGQSLAFTKMKHKTPPGATVFAAG